MKKVTLDFSDCKTVQALHRELKKKLFLPDYYGENGDALWDLLSGFCETPMHVVITPCTKGTADVMCEMEPIQRIFSSFAEEFPENKITQSV